MSAKAGLMAAGSLGAAGATLAYNKVSGNHNNLPGVPGSGGGAGGASGAGGAGKNPWNQHGKMTWSQKHSDTIQQQKLWQN